MERANIEPLPRTANKKGLPMQAFYQTNRSRVAG